MTLILSFMFLQTRIRTTTVVCLVLIVVGVAFASVPQGQAFQVGGFLLAIGSNFSFGLRNVLSKMSPAANSNEGQDVLGYFSVYSFLCLLATLPFLLGVEILRFILPHGSIQKHAHNHFQTYLFLQIGAAFSHAAYNIASFAVLSRVSAVTHALGNSVKRIFVVGTALVMFDRKVSPITILGCTLTFVGISLYTKQRLNSDPHRPDDSPTVDQKPEKQKTGPPIKIILRTLFILSLGMFILMSCQSLKSGPESVLGKFVDSKGG
jgi:solute carrier family 35, member E1